MRLLTVGLVLTSMYLAGCGEPPATRPSPAVSTAASAGPAAPAASASASPGPTAGDDWCAEHGVPESACTRCDSRLIPAFKATRDWCAEHGLPESQCLKCNPGLKIVRPSPGAQK